jgi:hypothetical protein
VPHCHVAAREAKGQGAAPHVEAGAGGIPGVRVAGVPDVGACRRQTGGSTGGCEAAAAAWSRPCRCLSGRHARSISSLARAVTHPHICWPDLSSKHQTVHPPTHLQSGRSRGHSAPRARCPAAGAAAAARPPVPAVPPVPPSLRPACGAAGRLSHNRTAPSLRSTVIIDDR